MTRRTVTVNTLKEYFEYKGKFLSADEYKKADDTPIRFQAVKRAVGSWSRLKGLIGPVGTPPKEENLVQSILAQMKSLGSNKDPVTEKGLEDDPEKDPAAQIEPSKGLNE